MTCRLVHRRQHTDTFEVRPGVRQGCLRSPVMFPLTMDWVMKTSTVQERSGIQWTLWRQLNDLDYVDYLALLSHTRHQMQEKTSAIADAVAHLDLNIHNGKRNVLTFNTVTDTPIVWEAEALDEVESFTYLCSIVDTTVHCRGRGGGGGQKLMQEVASARQEQLSNSWRMSGDHHSSAPALNSGSSTPSWSLHCSMKPKPGEPPSPLWKESRLSLTPASEEFLRDTGQTSSTTKICGNERESSP